MEGSDEVERTKGFGKALILAIGRQMQTRNVRQAQLMLLAICKVLG